MIIIVIKKPESSCPYADEILAEYPDCCVFGHRQHTDQELLGADPALIVLTHQLALQHAKALRTAAGSRMLRIIVVLGEGFSSQAINARIAGADVCLLAPLSPGMLARAILGECAIMRRIKELSQSVDSHAKINGRFRLESFLSASRHATVVLATDEKNNAAPVTIKLLRKAISGSMDFIAEFYATAKKLQELNSPYLAPILEAGDWEGYAYQVTGIGKAENLYSVMAKRQLEELEIARIALTVTRGLMAMTEVGLLHSDVKPENILFYNKQYLLADFGSVMQFANPDCFDFTYWPDSAFTCPEFFSEDPWLSPRSDTYSLGLVLYVLIARENPFAGRSCQWNLKQRLTENVVKITQENVLKDYPTMARNLEAMLQCRPDKRPRLRELELIFSQTVTLLETVLPEGTPKPSATQIQRQAAEAVKNDGEEALPRRSLAVTASRRSLNLRVAAETGAISNPAAGRRRLIGWLAAAVIVIIGVGFVIGSLYGKKSVKRVHFQQGPLMMFTCYNGHTHADRTLDLRNYKCRECGEPATQSYTCRACRKVYGLSVWPKRDMTEKESQQFEEKLSKCPFCESKDIYPTPLQGGDASK
ncbi:MAG TPA: protein kinase [Lentisphaeria bacterium]|nr:protein kinase [Lentisphaeria bacterium]